MLPQQSFPKYVQLQDVTQLAFLYNMGEMKVLRLLLNEKVVQL